MRCPLRDARWKFKSTAFLRDFPQNWHVDHTWGQHFTRIYRFWRPCVESTAPATKKMDRGIRSRVTATRNESWRSWSQHKFCTRFHTLSVSRLQTSCATVRKHCACHAKCTCADPLQIHHACQRFWTPHKLLRLPRTLANLANPLRMPCETHFEPSKTPRAQHGFNDFDFERVYFLDIFTSKNAPRLSILIHFDLPIALSLQPGAFWRYLHFKKCRTSQFLRFWLWNRSLATTGCAFWHIFDEKVSAPARSLEVPFRPVQSTAQHYMEKHNFSRKSFLPDMRVSSLSDFLISSDATANPQLWIYRKLIFKLSSMKNSK